MLVLCQIGSARSLWPCARAGAPRSGRLDVTACRLEPARCDIEPAEDEAGAGHMSVVKRAGRGVRGHGPQGNVACCGTRKWCPRINTSMLFPILLFRIQ